MGDLQLIKDICPVRNQVSPQLLLYCMPCHNYCNDTASQIAVTKEVSTSIRNRQHPSTSEHGLSPGKTASWSHAGSQRRNALVTNKNIEIGPLMKRKLSLPPINTHHK